MITVYRYITIFFFFDESTDTLHEIKKMFQNHKL